MPPWVKRAAGTVAAFGLVIVVFGAIVLVKGANPVSVLSDMVHSIFRSPTSIGEVLIKAAPLVLAGLAVAVPARAGLINVGGEGQIVIGAVAAGGVGLWLDRKAPGIVTLIAMALAAGTAGALWSGLAAVLRLTARVNEAISTLLLNYVAVDLMLFLIYDRWKDPHGSGQPATRPLAVAARLPVIGNSRVHFGIVIALVAAVVVWLVLRTTSWGFCVGVAGGNPEAARRAGLPVTRLLVSSMLLGGALAGLGGMVHFAGAEFQLRPGFAVGLGYTAFLASWLARHRSLGVAAAAVLLAAIAIGGDSLQLDSNLPAATVNILMALTLFAVLGRNKVAAS